MATITRARRIVFGLLVICLAVSSAAAGVAHAQSEPETAGVMVGRIDAPIDAVSARILKGWIESAESSGAILLVIEIDTPGGSFNATRDMAGALLESSVPVSVYVGPSGARAASAGTFIVAAGHIAAMAPGTNIGAASPVSSSGDDLPETIKTKATQDAAAFLREIATRRNRNSEALERTVFEAASYSADEAIDLGIVNMIAEDVTSLVRLIDGKTVTVAGVERTLSTADAAIEWVAPSPVQRVQGWVANPHLVFILLVGGGILLLVELISPGGWVAGVAGATLLALAFVGITSLPFNWIGLVLMGAGLILIFYELQAPGWGGFGAAGGIALVLGGFFLFGDTSVPGLPEPDVRVGWGVLGGVAAFIALSVYGLFHFSRKAKGITVHSRKNEIIGTTGEVRSALDPTGTVQVASELWTAESDTGEPIEAGESVIVAEVDGIKLKVFRESSI